MKKAIFLDRDGTINVEKDYLYRIEDFVFEDGVIEGLKILKELGYIFIVVTNQSGIARGYYTKKDVEVLNLHIQEILAKEGICIEKFYYCPHHAEKGIGKYKVECNCRKPKTGMLDSGVEEFDIDREASYMVGDNISDLQAGINVGMKPILVTTGHGANHLDEAMKLNAKIYPSLYDFAMALKIKK